ncbi:GNAT family N-acetyltransferase [Desulfobacula phenolica]|uniref:Acetyltransferase (GNAT) family protein n=1 Tax=Desulfobacula phenolica TaxID=90732 RepID=A0A1H2IBQ6_9BACT|nr:GNAT family N-acetyltransferase [Desulfobacula phenolica]SDU41547.1 Acetyltransferase (GNAT) family protein [Desulfobacula phenolica]
MIIAQIETIDEIKPIFREYLKYMSRFFKIDNYDLWCKGALKNLQLYLIKEDRHVYLLKKSDVLIGFAMINKHLRFNTKGVAVAEFYIQKGHEKKGYGRKLAEHVFAQLPGNWEVAVTLKNSSALAFWEHVVSSYTHGNFIKKRKPSFSGYGFLFNVSGQSASVL